MGIFIGIVGSLITVVGGIVALVNFVTGMGYSPASAPQQTVQVLVFVVSAIGLAVVGIGAAVFSAGVIVHQLSKPSAGSRS